MHAELRAFAPNRVVEKASYDDFYLDVSPACSGAFAADTGLGAAPAGLSFAGSASWKDCPTAIRAGIQVRMPLSTCICTGGSCIFSIHVGSTIIVFVALLALRALVLGGCGGCCSIPGMTGFRAV